LLAQGLLTPTMLQELRKEWDRANTKFQQQQQNKHNSDDDDDDNSPFSKKYRRRKSKR
jgi:hypothetical protein